MLADDVNTLLNDKKLLLTEVYFKLQEHFEAKYGTNTVIFMEIGTFVEVYEVNNDEMQIGKAKEMAELLNIQLTKKNKTIVENSTKNPLLAGVPTISFERYLNRLIQEQKYTIIYIKQRGLPPKVSRYVDKIISPGTNFDYTTDSEDNYIVSLLVDKHKDIYSIGYSAIDVTTGKTFLYEAHGTSEDQNFALDEIFNLLHVYKTSEVVLSFLEGVDDQKHILRYLEIDEHYTYSVNNQRPKIDYQNELFKRVYQIQSLLSPIEHLDLERTPMISEALAVLVHFVIEHDFHIIQKLSRPQLIDNRRYMYLGNSAFEQLGVISKDKDELTLLKLIDKSVTAIGKRLLKERLLNPIMEEEELTRRFNLAEKVSSHAKLLEENLRNIYDLERLSRRTNLGRLHPFEMNFIYDSLLGISDLMVYIKKHKLSKTPFSENEVLAFVKEIEKTFNLDVTRKYTIQAVDENFLARGVDPHIDELSDENSKMFQTMSIIMDKIEEMVSSVANKSENRLVSLGQLDKEGYFINLSKNRFSMIETEFSGTGVEIDGKFISFKEFHVKKLTNNVKITCELIENLSDKIMRNKAKIVALAKEKFIEKQHQLERRYTLLFERMIHYVADIDVAVSTAKTADMYNYARPMLVKTHEDENFLQILELRHPLIEVQEHQGIYVPNDIVMGNREYMDLPHPETIMLDSQVHDGHQIHGVLLYGINSSGKSSLMKSIGLSVLMAQSGFFVPASAMRFSLFESIFTRIVSKDNLSKGLSTFAVEMLEMKNIFNRAGTKSLILGDEVSHGTETLSGVAIVASAIMKLAKIRSIFLFATHLHQLSTMDEVVKLKNVVNLHLEVAYDENSDKLLYNRTLQSGSGSSIYGLEFAKSLHMDQEFLDVANNIRKRLANDYDELELLVKKKKRSKYNKDLYVTKCIICGNIAEEVHHISHQAHANQAGFIGHFHQDHKHNLIPLCKDHHNEIHSGKIIVKGFRMTSTGLELEYEEQLKNS